MKYRILLLWICLLALIVPSIFADTVMVSYDLFLNVADSLNTSSYINLTSIDVETGVMNQLFDRGHIVFNAPGQVYVKEQSPSQNDLQSSVARRSLQAANGGADMFIYLKLYFNGQDEDSLRLAGLDYEIFQVRNQRSVVDADNIIYENRGLFRINGEEASQILMSRIHGANIF